MIKLLKKMKFTIDNDPGFKPMPYELHDGYGEITGEIYRMVDEFHKQFNHPRHAVPTPELLKLRASLIHEEAVNEGISAAMRGDIEQTLDALADFLYVGVGSMAAIEHGVIAGMTVYSKEQSIGRFIETFFVPGNSALDDLAIPFNEAGEAALMLDELANRLANKKMKKRELVNDLRRAMNKIYVACMMAYRTCDLLKVDVLKLVGEIHRSNMTKLWPANDEERIKAVSESKYDASDIGFRIAKGGDMVIGYRISDGKILKSPYYSKPDLAQFVESAKSSAMYENIKNQL